MPTRTVSRDAQPPPVLSALRRRWPWRPARDGYHPVQMQELVCTASCCGAVARSAMQMCGHGIPNRGFLCYVNNRRDAEGGAGQSARSALARAEELGTPQLVIEPTGGPLG
jgi:hypothetical protein